MVSVKLAASVLLLALLVGGAGAYALLADLKPGPAGAYRVRVEGPRSAILFEGSVDVEGATALSVLEAAAERARLALEVERYPGMGAYVRAIGDHRATGGSGWVYEVRAPGGAWVSGDRSAELYDLAPGDEVRWRWTEG